MLTELRTGFANLKICRKSFGEVHMLVRMHALILGVLFVSLSALAGPEDFHPSSTIDLRDFRGQPLFQVMVDKEEGIIQAMNFDITHKFTIAGVDRVKEMEGMFEDKVIRKMTANFKNGKKDFYKLIKALDGKTATPGSLAGVIGREIEKLNIMKDPGKIGLSAVTISPFLALVSGSEEAGATVEVRLNKDNTTRHFGYKTGDGERDPKSGRSFSESFDFPIDDKSDVAYLKALAKYLHETENPAPFYRNMFRILTGSDTRGIARLEPEGQAVLADWASIYIAEARRHHMTKLKRHPWEIDLTAVSMMGPFTNESGMIRDIEGNYVDGELHGYFYVGKQGTGLGGKAGKSRQVLGGQIASDIKRNEPDTFNALAEIIDFSGRGDLCTNAIRWINTPRAQRAVNRNANEFVEAATDYVMATQRRAQAIRQKLMGE